MATNPYSYGSLGQRWTVGEPTSKSLLDVSRVKADANRWALEQLIVDPDDTANFVLTAPGLNIDSNTLYVDSVNNSVGFGLTNPNDYAFNGTPSWVASGGAGNASVIVVSGTTSTGYLSFADGTTGTDRYSGNIQYNHGTNTMSFRTNGGVEAMTINSAQDVAVNGDTLFVDASADRVGINTASPQLSVSTEVPLGGFDGFGVQYSNETKGELTVNPSTGEVRMGATNSTGTYFTTLYSNGSERARIDLSGNMGLGDTPNAYKSSHRALQLGTRGANIAGRTDSDTIYVNANAYQHTDGNWKYDSTDEASQYYQTGGTHNWRRAASGTAGTNITWTTQAVLDSTGLGIGTTSPSALIHAEAADGTEGGAIKYTAKSQASAYLSASPDGAVLATDTAGIVFRTGITPNDPTDTGTERARIDSSGNFLVGRTGTDQNAETGLVLSGDGYIYHTQNSSSANFGVFVNRTAASTNNIYFKTDALVRGSIQWTNTSTSYNTSSDYRLKENVVDITDGITRIKSLKPSRFNFLADADRTVDGFVAHEVSDIVPEAISGAKDAVDDEGNPQYQGIDQSKLVPLLTAALQEAITKIETLETKVAALEAA